MTDLAPKSHITGHPTGSKRNVSGLGGSVLFLLLAISFPIFFPSLLAGQVVRGVVIDDTNGTPVPGAIVRLFREGLGTETDDHGRFSFTLRQGGNIRLEVARMGYENAVSQPLRVERGDTVEVEFLVRPDAVVMAPLTITGRSRLGRDRFERRRRDWDRGIFLTPAMIDSISPKHPAEVLKGLEMVDVRWGWGVSSTGMPGPMPRVRTSLGRGCMLYMVDFQQVNPPPWVRGDWASPLLSTLAGDHIVAVEVYRSVLEVPKELRRFTDRNRLIWRMSGRGAMFQDDIQCGLTVFWTGAGW